MSNRRDDWDGDEREALDGLETELAEIRGRHQDDPSLAMLRAADQDALPQDLQSRVERHLRDSAWSRALVDGLRETGADDHLDAESEDRLFERIAREARAETPAAPVRSWKPALIMGGLALAASVLVAVVVSRPRTPAAPEPAASPTRPMRPPVIESSPQSKVEISYAKPEVKLSAAALTWRGDASAKPFIEAVAPAFEAYRAGDYAKAVAAFDELSTMYPTSIEVLFYQGVSLMLAGNDAAAVAPLQAAARLDSSTFAEDVEWFLAVARARSGDPDAAVTFNALCGSSGAHASEACAAAAQLRSATQPIAR
jgi:hypothetical protein